MISIFILSIKKMMSIVVLKIKYPERTLKYPVRILSIPGLLFVCLADTIGLTDYFVYSDNEPFADAKHPPG